MLLQNQRMIKWLRLEWTPGGHLIQIPCWNRQLRSGNKWPCLGTFWRSPRKRLYSLSGQPMIHTILKGFLMFKWILFCSRLCPLPLDLSVSNTPKSLSLSSILPSFEYSYAFMIFTASLLFSELDNAISLSISSQGSCTSPLIFPVIPHWTLSSMIMSLMFWST